MKEISWEEWQSLCIKLGDTLMNNGIIYLYPVPKNGAYIVLTLNQFASFRNHFIILNEPIIKYEGQTFENTCIIDDIIDSGKTLKQYEGFLKAVIFLKNSEINKDKIDFFVEPDFENNWIKFPWEKENDVEDNIIRMIEYIGENPQREGLKDTPKRVIKSWQELYAGYKQKPEDILTVFEDYGNYDEMITLKSIKGYSTCEHHLLPFEFECSVSYIPDGKVIGVSKIARLVEMFGRRLQVQERMTSEIAETLQEYLKPKGVAVRIEGQHLCMTARGIKKQECKMVTTKLTGVFMENEKARKEFFDTIR